MTQDARIAAVVTTMLDKLAKQYAGGPAKVSNGRPGVTEAEVKRKLVELLNSDNNTQVFFSHAQMACLLKLLAR
jgi:hypothetical protein